MCSPPTSLDLNKSGKNGQQSQSAAGSASIDRRRTQWQGQEKMKSLDLEYSKPVQSGNNNNNNDNNNNASNNNKIYWFI